MKNTTNIQRATQYLQKVGKLVNEKFFDGALPMPTITIQSSVSAYGHCTTRQVWSNTQGCTTYEINIGAETLDRPIENTVATMIHEFVHLFCRVNGITEVSANGFYHNKMFKKLAEERGLIIEKHPQYGFTITSPGEAVLDFCIDNDLRDIELHRETPYSIRITGGASSNNGTMAKPVRKPSSTRKYVCPCCGNSFRATKTINVLCIDCGERFVEA